MTLSIGEKVSLPSHGPCVIGAVVNKNHGEGNDGKQHQTVAICCVLTKYRLYGATLLPMKDVPR